MRQVELKAISLPREILDLARKEAQKQNRSFSNLVAVALKSYLERGTK